MKNKKTVLVLGGYGNFGKRICESLSVRSDIHLIVAGRYEDRAIVCCDDLIANGANCTVAASVVDINSDNFREKLAIQTPDIVIHTAGPFQGQDYRVANTCIEIGCHYIDLADDRRFVCNFKKLAKLAKDKNVIAISGASSVPGLSSVVIDEYINEFNGLDEIDFCIVPGSNVDLGEATLRGILSYTGKAFTTWQQNKMIPIYAWQNVRRKDLGGVLGWRWLGNIDIPDLELFPARYRGVKTVRFQAGHELFITHFALVLLGLLSKLKLVNHWDRYTKLIYQLGQLFKKFGTDTGGMFIQMTGHDKHGMQQVIKWRLVARKGVGPYIPTISTVILTNKLLDGELRDAAAVPCLGMYTLQEFSRIADTWGIYQEVERMNG